MTATEILRELYERGITLRVEGARLIAQPITAIPPELLKVARTHKPEIIAILSEPLRAGDSPIPLEVALDHARRLGWPEPRLTGRDFWPISARGLMAVFDPATDSVLAVEPDWITFERRRPAGDLISYRFLRCHA